jgi:uncharacterized protein YodC (DUF2158 family)
MAEPKFDIGATVKLKSGGPTMIVSAHSDGQQYKCRWFDAKASLKADLFAEAELELVELTTRFVVELNDGPPPTRQE